MRETAPIDPKLKAAIDAAIAKEHLVRIRAYAVISATESGLSYIVESILKKYGRDDMIGPVYTSVKELSLNGAKANFKRILFEDENLNSEDDADYDKGMGLFKENLNENWVLEYGKKSKSRKLYVDIFFDFNADRLIVEVLNNRPISQKEDKRIREKFHTAMRYDDIAQFYMEGGDSSEGAGMGIVLVTMMLKAQQIDPHLFTIRSDYREKTLARVEFPLSHDYQPSRQRFITESNAELVLSV
ncbi:MAG: hypothetical protein J0L53_03135 [Spirochaetes bacterium]|nr:hypothetical protein [Spirochaetota bacterium]MBX3721062.1 hypothetical protein [Turneriella sp.]